MTLEEASAMAHDAYIRWNSALHDWRLRKVEFKRSKSKRRSEALALSTSNLNDASEAFRRADKARQDILLREVKAVCAQTQGANV